MAHHNKSSITCPHCDYELNNDDMIAVDGADLFAIAPNEDIAHIVCPACDKPFVVQGSYRPEYTTAFAEEELI